MLVIVRPRTKKRLMVLVKVMVTVFIFALVIGHFYNITHGKNMIREGWLRDDKPSGNPMRVENVPNHSLDDKKSGPLSEFVVKLRDFYHREP